MKFKYTLNAIQEKLVALSNRLEAEVPEQQETIPKPFDEPKTEEQLEAELEAKLDDLADRTLFRDLLQASE